MRLLLLALLVAPTLVTAQTAAPVSLCSDAETHAWLQQALASWERLRHEVLRLERRPVPWVVAFDDTCVWHVNPDPILIRELVEAGSTGALNITSADTPTVAMVNVISGRHHGTIRLPDGATVEAKLATFVAPYGGESTPFLVTALPSIWRSESRLAGNPRLPTLIRSVFAHEMTHTLQSRALGARIDAIATRHGLADLTDDVIQDRFADVSGFRQAYEREVELFYAAAAAPDPAIRRQLAQQAADAMKARRARYLSGRDAHFAELEDLFLNMEGAANWVAYRSALTEGLSPDDALSLIRRDGRRWSQDEGLAVFLVLDALDVNWRANVFSDVPSTLLELLPTPTH